MSLNSHSTASYFAAAIALIAVAVISTTPISDGDIWWQMAYGRYFIENATLIPDHSVFTWTVASNSLIYCAWIAEIILYGIYEAAGLNGLFALRYVAMLLPMALALWVSSKSGSRPPALVWLAFLLCYLMSNSSGGLIKPEIFGFMLMSVVVANYYVIKCNDQSWKLCYVFPIVMLLWVNTHGGFIIGLAFLGVISIGELINYVSGSPTALKKETIKHLAIAAVLTLFATICTPYGVAYPVQVVIAILTVNNEHLASVGAYENIFSPRMAHYYYPLYLFLSVVLILPLLAEQMFRRRLDYSLLVVNIFFIAFYVLYIRMTYFYAIIMLFSFQHLLISSQTWESITANQSRTAKITAWVSVAMMLALTSHRVIDRLDSPSQHDSFSFGVSYYNPVSEEKFISTNFSHLRLCNGYTGGGYLLWKRWPQQKVMIDPRYFPFISWFDEWRKLTRSKNSHSLLSNYDCGVWSINHLYNNLVRSLHSSPEWQLVFIGASSAVFVHKSSLQEDWSTQAAEDLWQLSDPYIAIKVLALLLDNKDFKIARQLAASMEQRFQGRPTEEMAKKAVDYAYGVFAYYQREYAAAYHLLKASQIPPISITNPIILINANQFLTRQLWELARYKEARDVAMQGVKLAPEDHGMLFNAGILLLANPHPDVDPIMWRQYLKKFISLSKANPNHASLQYVTLAESILISERLLISSVAPLVPMARPPVLNSISLYY